MALRLRPGVHWMPVTMDRRHATSDWQVLSRSRGSCPYPIHGAVLTSYPTDGFSRSLVSEFGADSRAAPYLC